MEIYLDYLRPTVYEINQSNSLSVTNLISNITQQCKNKNIRFVRQYIRLQINIKNE